MNRLFAPLLLAASFPMAGCTADNGDKTERSLQLLERSASATAPAEALYIAGDGEFDLSARFQGMRPGQPDWVPLSERLVLDGKVVIYETHARVNPDADEHMRYRFDGEGRMQIIDLLNRRAFWDTGPHVFDQADRYARLSPGRLIADALRLRSTLRPRGPSAFNGRNAENLEITLPTGEALTLHLDAEQALLLGVSFMLDMPHRGDTRVTWRFGPYRDWNGVGMHPEGYEILLGDQLLKSVQFTQIARGGPADMRSTPGDIEVPPAPEVAQESTQAPRPLPEPRELADGVYLFPHIRSGFHVLLVEFPEFFLAVDAPAGYYELQQIPALNWATGETSSSVGRKFLEVARALNPDKPVRHVVLTHWHGDHSGGIRPFVANGTTILTAPVTASLIRQTLRKPFTLAADELSGIGLPEPDIIEVEGRHRIEAGGMAVEVIDVGPNPHADGMLVVWLPGQRILFNSDLFEPASPRFFPSRARVPVMKWFVEWLNESGLDPEQIISIHGAARVSEEQLELIRVLPPDPATSP